MSQLEATPLLYTVNQSAERLSLSVAKVFQLIADGSLASVKVGRSRRITAAALEDFVARLEHA